MVVAVEEERRRDDWKVEWAVSGDSSSPVSDPLRTLTPVFCWASSVNSGMPC